ncbi:MAG: heavy metal-associated domain-containing protein [Anaerolineales bacterium]
MRLEAAFQGKKGIIRAHVERDKSPIDLCLHYDPNLLTLSDVKRLAELAGAQIVNRYHHESIPIENMDCSDCSLVIEHSVGRMEGVLSVNVNYPTEKCGSNTTITRSIAPPSKSESARWGIKFRSMNFRQIYKRTENYAVQPFIRLVSADRLARRHIL